MIDDVDRPAGTPGPLDRVRLLAVPVMDLPLLALPKIPLAQPLTGEEIAQIHGWFRDVERVVARIAAEWLPRIRALVDELVAAGIIPPPPPEGETMAERVIRERRTRRHGPAARTRAPRVLGVGGRR